jgi:hypothetical protein
MLAELLGTFLKNPPSAEQLICTGYIFMIARYGKPP